MVCEGQQFNPVIGHSLLPSALTQVSIDTPTLHPTTWSRRGGLAHWGFIEHIRQPEEGSPPGVSVPRHAVLAFRDFNSILMLSRIMQPKQPRRQTSQQLNQARHCRPIQTPGRQLSTARPRRPCTMARITSLRELGATWLPWRTITVPGPTP